MAVTMYDDHLEIINTGTLHFDLTPKQLSQRHPSRPWNPIIANVFYRVGIIVQWGTGTLKIFDWCRENANPALVWKEQSGSVAQGFTSQVTRKSRARWRSCWSCAWRVLAAGARSRRCSSGNGIRYLA